METPRPESLLRRCRETGFSLGLCDEPPEELLGAFFDTNLPEKLGATARQVRKKTGLPIFVIETEYPTGPGLFGYSEAKQCQYIRIACETAFTCDAITGLGWFRFSDSYWRSSPPRELLWLAHEERKTETWMV